MAEVETLKREIAQLKHLLATCNQYQGILNVINQKELLQNELHQSNETIQEQQKKIVDLTNLLEVQNEEAIEILTEKAMMFNKVLVLEKRVDELKQKVRRYKDAISKLK